MSPYEDIPLCKLMHTPVKELGVTEMQREPTVRRIEPDPSYPTETGMCLRCLRIVDEAWNYCAYCGNEIIWPEEKKEDAGNE